MYDESGLNQRIPVNSPIDDSSTDNRPLRPRRSLFLLCNVYVCAVLIRKTHPRQFTSVGVVGAVDYKAEEWLFVSHRHHIFTLRRPLCRSPSNPRVLVQLKNNNKNNQRRGRKGLLSFEIAVVLVACLGRKLGSWGMCITGPSHHFVLLS